jgi:hypothetical protein
MKLGNVDLEVIGWIIPHNVWQTWWIVHGVQRNCATGLALNGRSSSLAGWTETKFYTTGGVPRKRWLRVLNDSEYLLFVVCIMLFIEIHPSCFFHVFVGIVESERVWIYTFVDNIWLWMLNSLYCHHNVLCSNCMDSYQIWVSFFKLYVCFVIQWVGTLPFPVFVGWLGRAKTFWGVIFFGVIIPWDKGTVYIQSHCPLKILKLVSQMAFMGFFSGT